MTVWGVCDATNGFRIKQHNIIRNTTLRPRGRLPGIPDGFYYSIIKTVLNG